MEELKVELDTCRRRLDAKYQAVAILKEQVGEIFPSLLPYLPSPKFFFFIAFPNFSAFSLPLLSVFCGMALVLLFFMKEELIIKNFMIYNNIVLPESKKLVLCMLLHIDLDYRLHQTL